MQAADIMTTAVVSVTPDTTVQEIAQLLLEKGISAVPVVGEDGRLAGIVSEGDLMRRVETGTESHRSWWLDFFSSPTTRQEQFVKSHGRRAKDVMTRKMVTVAPSDPLAEVAQTLESNRIKRVPVVVGGKMIGIISRANLLHGLASAAPPRSGPTPDDRVIREAIVHAIDDEIGLGPHHVNVVVRDGAVQIWGTAQDEAAAHAIIVAAETVDGVKSVESHLGRVPPWAYGY